MTYSESFLSDYARTLLCPAQSSSSHPEYNVCGDFLIDFEALPNAVINHLSLRHFPEALLEVLPIISLQTTLFATQTTLDLAKNHLHLFEWLTDPVDFLELHARLSIQHAVEQMLLLQRVTALIEGSLSGLHWRLDPKCPNTMKDLLTSPALETMFGKKCLLFLSLFFGPVNSINLRNLVWHGFISPTDARNFNKRLLPFIFVIILSLGKRLVNQQHVDSRKPSRISSLEPFSNKRFIELRASEQHFTDVVPSHPVGSCSSMEYFTYIDTLLNLPEPRYLDALCLSFVCLSVLLRCEFTDILNAPNFCNSAEDRFFLTLDTILEFKTDTVIEQRITQDQFTRFCARCGDLRVLAVLLDILCSDSGPRIKDRLSHGEYFVRRSPVIDHSAVSWNSIEQHFEYSALLMKACLMTLLSTRNCLSVDTSTRTTRWLFSYQLEFHPTAQFSHNWRSLSDRLVDLSHRLETGSYVSEPLQSLLAHWFPNQPSGPQGPSLSYLITNLWLIVQSWSSSTSSASSGWVSRPSALVTRLNQLLVLYLTVSDCLHSALVEYENAKATGSVSSRKHATFERMMATCSPLLCFLNFVITFTAHSWNCWIDGAVSSLSRVDCRQLYSMDLKARAKLIDGLQRTGDKLTMWITKSKWELILPFLQSVTYPLPQKSE